MFFIEFQKLLIFGVFLVFLHSILCLYYVATPYAYVKTLMHSIFIFFLFSCVWFFFDTNRIGILQYFIGSQYSFSFTSSIDSHWLKLPILGLDSISLLFIMLTSFLFPMCFLYVLEDKASNTRFFFFNMLILQFMLTLAFLVVSLLLFYFIFESVLVPTYIIIIGWGARVRRLKGAHYFFVYTLVSSSFMLYALLYWTSSVNSLNLISLKFLTDYYVSFAGQKFIWLCCFLAFSVKVPIFPLHIWLPEAHAEAPTVGSVILGGLLLKLGGYGFLKFLVPIMPEITGFYSKFLLLLNIFSFTYAAMLALRQTDLKKIIAYSSISHMNFSMIGLLSQTYHGVMGSILIMLNHGLVAAALFFIVGFLYRRSSSRLITYYSGLVETMPIFSTMFFIFSIISIDFPLFTTFLGEFLTFSGFFSSGDVTFIFITLLLGFVMNTALSILTVSKVIFGYLKNTGAGFCYDVSLNEFLILFFLAAPIFFFGLNATSLLDMLTPPLAYLP